MTRLPASLPSEIVTHPAKVPSDWITPGGNTSHKLDELGITRTVIVSGTEPTTKVDGMLWLDTSTVGAGTLSDFYTEVQKGNITGHSLVHKFGRNDVVPNGSWEMVSLLSVPTAFRSSASTVRIKAGGNAADTAAGAGAREVTVVGIDTTLAEVSETIATAGAGASAATTASFWRTYRAYVSSNGTYGAANTAAITIEDSGGAADMITIGVEEGQSQHGAYTIPTGKTGYFLHATVTVDASKAADVKFCKRESFNDATAPMEATRLITYWDGLTGVLDFSPKSPGGALPALTDVWFEASGSGAATEVSVDFEILLVDD